MAKATNLTRKKHDKPSAKIDEDGRPVYLESPVGFTFTWNRPLCAVLMLLGGGGGAKMAPPPPCLSCWVWRGAFFAVCNYGSDEEEELRCGMQSQWECLWKHWAFRDSTRTLREHALHSNKLHHGVCLSERRKPIGIDHDAICFF